MTDTLSWAERYGPSAVYRLYDDEGQLLYVGCTRDIETRLAEHFPPQSQPRGWHAEVARIETTPYPDRRSALDAEAQAILREGPLYNNLRVVYRVHRQRFGPPCLPDQDRVIRERIARRLGEDPGVWAYARRREPTRIAYDDLIAEIAGRTNRSCTKDQLAAWARENGPDPWAAAVALAWTLPAWTSGPANEWEYAHQIWRLP